MMTISKKMSKKKISDILSEEDKKLWSDCVKDIKKFPDKRDVTDIYDKKAKFIYIERNDAFILKNRLDLHGYTINQAYETLFAFIEINFKAGRRIIYVITGKGKPESSETLNKLVPRWLNEKPLNAFVSSAAFSSSNAGELCVKLKKQK